MDTYNKISMLELLDTATIKALSNIYQIKLKHLAVRLNCTKQNVKYHVDNDSFKQWQKEKILELFIDQGLEMSELIIINSLTKKKITLNTDRRGLAL